MEQAVLSGKGKIQEVDVAAISRTLETISKDVAKLTAEVAENNAWRATITRQLSKLEETTQHNIRTAN